MSIFDEDHLDPWPHAIAHVLASEGGLVDHKDDPGGITNFGVSLRFLKQHNLDIDHDGDVDADDIRRLDLEKAQSIYYQKFWEPYGYAAFPRMLAIKAFDMCVNMGPVQAHKIIQKALWGYGYKVKVDGVMGTQTTSAIHAIDLALNTAGLVATIRVLQDAFYTNLVASKPELKAFYNGWINRAYSC